MKIAIAGREYIGLLNDILLAQYNEAAARSSLPQKVIILNDKISHMEVS